MKVGVSMNKKDKAILRQLAAIYAEYANSDENKRNIVLHKAVNDLKTQQPVLLCDEIPWHEMNINNELTIQCEDPLAMGYEQHLRRSIYKWNRLRGHMVLVPYMEVHKAVNSTGIGLSPEFGHGEDGMLSHTYNDQINEENLDRLCFEKISYDAQTTESYYEQIADAIGDVIPVKIIGQPTGYGVGCKTLDDIVMLRGLDTLFFDLVEKPEFMHKLIGKLTDIFIDKIRQYETLDLLGESYYCHCATALSNDLPPVDGKVMAKNLWGRGLAQIFASVSPQMHDEFDTQYMIKAMQPFGLVYYGCCEPLDKKIDILEQIPNLRKISITPWADIDHAAEIIGKKYVIASKPNPSAVAVPCVDEQAAESEIKRMVDACKRNSCSCDIVLKDITTVNGNPGNLFRWHDIAMEVIGSC